MIWNSQLLLFTVCPRIVNSPIQSNKIEQDIGIETELSQYGVWNGTQVVAATEQELYFQNSFNRITLKHKDGQKINDSVLYHQIDSKQYSKEYYKERSYLAHVIWSFGQNEKRSQTCKEDRNLITSRWVCQNGEEIAQDSVCNGYHDCNDTDVSDKGQ